VTTEGCPKTLIVIGCVSQKLSSFIWKQIQYSILESVVKDNKRKDTDTKNILKTLVIFNQIYQIL
jgi:hypothetical protein